MKSLFGYIIVNKPEMKFKEFDLYHAYYCGLCRSLKKCYGMAGQISLSYDMTFLAMLLSGFMSRRKHAAGKGVWHIHCPDIWRSRIFLQNTQPI